MPIAVVERKLNLLPETYLAKVNEYIELLLLKVKSESKEEKNPVLEFSGCINDEDAKVMMAAIDECRGIWQNKISSTDTREANS